ncbi:uncharacterized protein BYT42DRAFT_400755 [Radiomyces spectabilis]|uniref:uncharacterized protein n=1 Tax=Radiomyces spectabilis TaxID=64574 RepID=UPI0022212325|nr:uncharacterized protein BYT42DRAFT_400755 [Radiomyces spectabilis]KAI8374347.1 hypothetical protein BYT42DRAFT_400755 [Radiomyces spectabilis]
MIMIARPTGAKVIPLITSTCGAPSTCPGNVLVAFLRCMFWWFPMVKEATFTFDRLQRPLGEIHRAWPLLVRRRMHEPVARKGMLNFKKVPRKPHPVGQEYMCIADNLPCILLRLGFVSDPASKKVATVNILQIGVQYLKKHRRFLIWIARNRQKTIRLRPSLDHARLEKAILPRGMLDDDILEVLGSTGRL